MLNKTNAFRVVLVALLMAALACNAVSNALGNDAQRDAQATVDAASTEAAEEFEDFATEDAEEPEDETTEEPGDSEEPTEESSTNNTGAPDDIPVMAGDNENFFATDSSVSYYSPATYDEVVQFYKDEMAANGWELDATLSTEFGGVAVLTYKKDNRTAAVTISPEPSSGKVVVAIGIVEQ